jgi:hypothetical protein
MSQPGQAFHAQDVNDVLSALELEPDWGLSGTEAKVRRRQQGADRLREAKRDTQDALP